MILVDAGPLVAIVDASDQHHRVCVAALRKIREPLGTVWPVLADAMYLLLDVPAGQQAIWEMVERRALKILDLGLEDVPRIRELMTKYADRPMDLADAALIRIAEREGLSSVFTVDRRDFAVYRIGGRKGFRILPGAHPVDQAYGTRTLETSVDAALDIMRGPRPAGRGRSRRRR